MFNIAYVLSWLECHTYTFSKVSAQLMHFEILTFEPLYNPLMTFNNIAYVLSWLECHTYTFSQV